MMLINLSKSNFMKKLILYALFNLVLLSMSTKAQITYPGSFEDYHFQTIKLKNATIDNLYSPNGIEFTPKGDFKVLIICVGFGAPYDSYEMPGWATGVNTLPDWVNNNSAFYRNNTEFNNPATVNDKNNISRFYYEMSKGTFRMTADVYPTRININPAGSYGWFSLNRKVIEKMKVENPNFDWAPYDKRTNSPNYLSDNSISNADSVPDYVVIVYRFQQIKDNTSTSNWYINPPIPGMMHWSGSGGGYAAINGLSGINYNGYTFKEKSGYTHCSGTSSIFSLFIHEVAHSIFDCSHYANANGIVGNYFYNQLGGWGMMNLAGTAFCCANGWERWYLGWIDLKTNGVNSDVKSSVDLPASKEFTLRDFITTGDVVRIKIPNGTDSDQYLWLENHQGKSIFDDRSWTGNGCEENSLPPSPRGLVAYVESIAGDRNYPFDFWEDTLSANGIKPLHSKGNYDYSFLGPSEISCLLWRNPIFNILQGIANPIAGQNGLEGIRLDYNSNNIIDIHTDLNNLGTSPNEYHWVAKRAGNMTYDFLGSDINFVVGQKLGIATNPALINRPVYDDNKNKMTSYYLNGISVLVSSIAPNGDVKVKVSYNDVEVNSNIRWTGNIVLPDITSNADPDLDLLPNKTITINKSGSSNRHTKTTTIDNNFINLTTFNCSANSYFRLQNNSKVIVDNSSTFTLESGSTLEINDGAQLVIENGSRLEVQSGATILIKGSGGIVIKCSGTLCAQQGSIINLQDVLSCIHFIGNGSLSSGCLTNLSGVITGNGSVQDHNNALTLSSSTISSDFYYSGTTITSTNVTIQGTGTDVVFDVSNDATINSNFTVPLGSTFEVKISSTSCAN